MTRPGSEARAHLAMVMFATFVAGSFSLGHVVANQIPPTSLNALRFAIALGILAPIVFLGHGVRRRHFLAPWRYLILGSCLAAYFVLMFEALKTASPVSTSAIFTLAPLMAAGFGFVLLRQRISPRMAIAIAVGAAGAVWVIFRGDVDALLALDLGHGEILFFGATIAHALYTPAVRWLHRGEPAPVVTLGTAAATLLVVSLYGADDLLRTDWSALPLVVWGVIVYLAVFASAASMFLLQYAALHLPSAKVMAYTYLIPSVVIVWELTLYGSTPAGIVLIGIGMTVLALLILLRNEDRLARSSRPAPAGKHRQGPPR